MANLKEFLHYAFDGAAVVAVGAEVGGCVGNLVEYVGAAEDG